MFCSISLLIVIELLIDTRTQVMNCIRACQKKTSKNFQLFCNQSATRLNTQSALKLFAVERTKNRAMRRTKQHPLQWAINSIVEGIEPKIAVFENSLMNWAMKHFPEHLFNDPSIFHNWIAKQLTDFHKRRGTNLNVIAPRGNAKSTWITLIYVVLAALEGWETYILIVSDSATQAKLFLEAVKDAIEFSPQLRKSYPSIAGKGSVWNQDRIVLKNGVLIEAFGVKAKIRGRRKGAHRPSLIIIDDPQNDENIESHQQRTKDQSWLTKAVANAGNKRTNIVMVGTSLHRESLVMNASRNAGWQSHIFKSIIQWPKRMELWKQWESIYCDHSNPDRKAAGLRFYLQNKRAMNDGAQVLWESEESLYELFQLRVKIGYTSFESEKQNNPRKPGTVEFPDEYFGDWIWVAKDNWPEADEFNIKVITVDPSKGKENVSRKKTGDYSAITMIGRCENKLLWTHADLARRPVIKIVSDTVAHAGWFMPDAIGVEANQFQELICDELIKQLEEAGLGFIPVIPINNHVNKVVRIRRLGPRLSSRELRFLKGCTGTKLLVEQLEDFPTAAYDDGPDCLEMGCRLMVDIFNSRHTGSQLGNAIKH